MAKEVIESFCKNCGFAIFVGWQHKCVPTKMPPKKPQEENKGGSFIVVAAPKVRGR